MEETSDGRDTEDIFNEESSRCEKGGGIASIVVSADRAIEGGIGLVEKKSWT